MRHPSGGNYQLPVGQQQLPVHWPTEANQQMDYNRPMSGYNGQPDYQNEYQQPEVQPEVHHSQNDP